VHKDGVIFFILTCSCGEEGCIGFSEDDAIKVTHTDSAIKWHIAEPKPERTFVSFSIKVKGAV